MNKQQTFVNVTLFGVLESIKENPTPKNIEFVQRWIATMLVVKEEFLDSEECIMMYRESLPVFMKYMEADEEEGE